MPCSIVSGIVSGLITLTATIRNIWTAGIPATGPIEEIPDQGLPWPGYEKMITVIFLSGCFYIDEILAVDDAA